MPVYPRAEQLGNSQPAPAWLIPFRPLIAQGDAQTIAGRYWPSPLDPALYPSEGVYFPTVPGVTVLGFWSRPASTEAPAAILAVHGLTGCADAQYMRVMARQALEAGFPTLRLNVRNCGGTERLAPTLYHSGLTEDLHAVIEALAPQPLFLVGFSMGGNMALKLAGEWGDNVPAHVKGVCAISTPIRLEACARRLGERRNRIYELRFLRQLRAIMRLKSRLMPQLFPEPDFRGVDTIFDFDDRFTAPSFGFDGAVDYYTKCSASGFLDRIRIPALLLQAEDDPFVPFSTYENGVFQENSLLHLAPTRTGGHVAFLARGAPRFWAQAQALQFFKSLL